MRTRAFAASALAEAVRAAKRYALRRPSACSFAATLRTWATGRDGPHDGLIQRRGTPARHRLWPADHRWFAATDVDSDFACVGRSQGLIDAVIADPKLSAERVHRN
jgi:hypothetical protein